VEIQPQLVMLQKTLLNIEGLGRQLDPDLDLWKTAKPFLEKWMENQMGWRGFVRNLKNEAPYWARSLPQIPRLAQQALAAHSRAPESTAVALAEIQATQARQERWLRLALLLVAGIFALELVRSFA